MPRINEQGDLIAKIILDDREYALKLNNINVINQAAAKQISSAWVKETTKMSKGTEDFGKKSNDVAKVLSSNWIARFGKIALGFTIWYRAINLVERALIALKDQATNTIKVIDDFEKQVLGVTAAIVAFADVKDPFTAYSEILPTVRAQMLDLELVAARHLVTAEELRTVYASLIKKGVFAVTDEDIQNVAILADTVKLFARDVGGVHQMQQEIFSLMEGQRGKGRELVYLFQAMYPDLRKQIEGWKEMGKDIEGNNILLVQLANSVQGLKAANEDIYKLYQTQISTLETYWSWIKRIGGEDTYRAIVDDLTRINELLITSEGPSQMLIDLAKEWDQFMGSVYLTVKSFLSMLISMRPLLEGINDIFAGWAYLLRIASGFIESIGATAQFFMDNPILPSDEAVQEFKKDMSDIWARVGEDIKKAYIFEWKLGEEKGPLPDPKRVEDNAKKQYQIMAKYANMRLSLIKEVGFSSEMIAAQEAHTWVTLTEEKINLMLREKEITKDEHEDLLKYLYSGYSRKLLQLSDDTHEGMLEGWKGYFDELGSMFERSKEFANEMAKGMQSGLKDFFIDVGKGELREFADYVRYITNALADYMSKVFMQLAFGEIDVYRNQKGGFLNRNLKSGETIWKWLGGLGDRGASTPPTTVTATGHEGGTILGRRSIIMNPPRAHGGMFIGDLRQDEVPIVARVGESIIAPGDKPRGGDTFNISIVANDPKSFADMIRRDPNSVIEPIIRAREMGVRI